MSTAPRFDIDLAAFWSDPYPALARLRKEAPIAFVPQLGSTVFTNRDDIFVSEKQIDVSLRVCLRILSGLSSEAISADLDISIHSTLTYRKRAYDKLGISSQNELFGIVLKLLMQGLN